MRYALIGCGRVSGNHIAAAIENKLEIVALCDLEISKAIAQKEKFSLPDSVAIYADYKEMLDNENLDIVGIATISGTHADIAVDCIHAGCHTIVEKPIALSLADADRIMEAERQMQVKVCTNHQNRFNVAVQHMRNALESNRFGKLLYGTTSIRWHRDEKYYGSADWRGTWKDDGGTLMNQCIHAIDLLRWMMGDEITEVIGYTDNVKHPYIEAEDLGLAMIRFKNGSYGLIDGTITAFGGDYEETLTVFGDKGFAKVGGNCVNKIVDWRFSDSEVAEFTEENAGENPPNVYGFGHKAIYADMIKAILTDSRPYVDSSAGRRALETVLAIYKSAAEGKPVQLPLENCATLDFSGRFDHKG